MVIRTTVRIGVHSQFPFEEGLQPHLTCVSAISCDGVPRA